MPKNTRRILPYTAIGEIFPDPVALLDWPRAIVTVFLILFLCGAFFIFTRDDSPAMYRVRLATPADVGDVTRLAIQAMPFDPQWNYRYTYREQFPNDHYKYTKMLYDQFASIENDDWRLVVVELLPGRNHPLVSAEKIIDRPEKSPRDQQSKGYEVAATGAERGEIMAFSVWDFSYINRRKYGLSYQPQNRKSSRFSHHDTELTSS